MIAIKFDKKQVAKALLQLGEKGAASAITMAINRVLPGVRTDAKKHLKEELKLKTAGPLHKKMKIHTASRKTLSGDVQFFGSIPLKAYNGVKVKKGKGGGVYFKGNKIDRSFRGSIKTLKNDFFQRTGKQRGPVKRLYGYTLPQEYQKNELHNKLTLAARNRMDKEWPRAIAQEIRKLGL